MDYVTRVDLHNTAPYKVYGR